MAEAGLEKTDNCTLAPFRIWLLCIDCTDSPVRIMSDITILSELPQITVCFIYTSSLFRTVVSLQAPSKFSLACPCTR